MPRHSSKEFQRRQLCLRFFPSFLTPARLASVSVTKYLDCPLSGGGLGFGFRRFNRLGRANADFNLLRLGFGTLLKLDSQHTRIIAGLHAFRIDRIRHGERPEEAAVTALNAVEVLFLLLFLKFALAANGQRVVFHLNVEIVLLHARDLKLEDNFVLILINVHRGDERCGCKGVGFTLTAGEVLEKRVHAVLKSKYIAKWIPTSDSHEFPPKCF